MDIELRTIITNFVETVSDLAEESKVASSDSILNDQESNQMDLTELISMVCHIGKLGKGTLITAFALLDRLNAVDGTVISSGCSYRAVVATLLIAIKITCDSTPHNSDFAEVVDLDPKTVNKMEMEVLTKLKFNLWVAPSLFEEYESNLNEYK